MLSTAIPLRDYQQTLTRAIYAEWRQHRRVMAQLPTGGGKTVVFSHIAQDFISRGQNVLVLAHRTELITQAADKLQAVTAAPVGIIKAGHAPNYDAPIQVASVQSLVRRLDRIQPPALAIIDEAHHTTAETYRKIVDWCGDAYQLGVTATPIRTDGSGFQDLFDALVTGPTVRELITAGHLCPFRLWADPRPMKTKGARTRQGDYSAGDLAALNSCVELSGSLVASYQKFCPGQRCIVFAVNIEHSITIADRYNSSGIPAAHLDGESSPEYRRQILDAFSRGEILVLSNVGLFTEGFDLPALDAVQIARPTKSLALWLQMLGRALRPSPGKDEATLLDHTKNWAVHGTPLRPRQWTLDRVENEGGFAPELGPGGEVREVPIITESPAELSEVINPEDDEWRQLFTELVAQQKAMGYKPGWLWYALIDLRPPLPVWQMAADYLGYKRGWAWHQFRQYPPLEAIAA